MKRFIDLRGQDTDGRFAWYDTVTQQFERHSGKTVWDTWRNYVIDCCATGSQQEQYRALAESIAAPIPMWAFSEPDNKPKKIKEAHAEPTPDIAELIDLRKELDRIKSGGLVWKAMLKPDDPFKGSPDWQEFRKEVKAENKNLRARISNLYSFVLVSLNADSCEKEKPAKRYPCDKPMRKKTLKKRVNLLEEQEAQEAQRTCKETGGHQWQYDSSSTIDDPDPTFRLKFYTFKCKKCGRIEFRLPGRLSEKEQEALRTLGTPTPEPLSPGKRGESAESAEYS